MSLVTVKKYNRKLWILYSFKTIFFLKKPIRKFLANVEMSDDEPGYIIKN